MSRNSLLEAGGKSEGEGEVKCTLKRVRDMTRTYSQIHRTDKYSEHNFFFRFLVFPGVLKWEHWSEMG